MLTEGFWVQIKKKAKKAKASFFIQTLGLSLSKVKQWTYLVRFSRSNGWVTMRWTFSPKGVSSDSTWLGKTSGGFGVSSRSIQSCSASSQSCKHQYSSTSGKKGGIPFTGRGNQLMRAFQFHHVGKSSNSEVLNGFLLFPECCLWFHFLRWQSYTEVLPLLFWFAWQASNWLSFHYPPWLLPR